MAPYRPDSRYARLRLPPLNPQQALFLSRIFEDLQAAIWAAHGNAMADFLGCTEPDAIPRPLDAVWTNDADDDHCI